MQRSSILLSILLTCSTALGAATYYVSPSGSVGNTGLSTLSPWTWTKAQTNLAAGVTLILMDGTYTGPLLFEGVHGTPAAPMVVQALNRWRAIVRDSADRGLVSNDTTTEYLDIDGLQVCWNAGMGIGGLMKGLCVRNCWVHHNGSTGVILISTNTRPSVVENNLLEHNAWTAVDNQSHGVYIGGYGGIVRNNVVRHNGLGFGIHSYTGDNSVTNDQNQIYNNLTYGHTNAYGVTVWGADGDDGARPGTNWVYGNTILDGFQIVYGGLGVSNNIILPTPANPTYPMYNSGTHPATIWADYNLSTLTLVTNGVHDVVSAPGLVSTNTGLAWLTSASAARSAAAATVCGTNDFFGRAQTTVTDIGAFQYAVKYENDTRTLDPSPGSPNYWRILGGTLRAGTLLIGPSYGP